MTEPNHDGDQHDAAHARHGLLWTALIALAFFQLSHPRTLISSMTESMWWLTLATLAVVLLDRKRVRLPRIPWTLALFMTWCLISTAWSINSHATLRAVVFYGWIAAFACLVVANCSPRGLIRGFMWGSLIVVVSTLLAAAIEFPGAGDWATVLGLQGNRNIVTYTLVLGLAATVCYRPRRQERLFWVVVLVGILGVLFLADSGTGWVTAAVVLVAVGAVRIERRFHLLSRLWIRVAGMVIVAGAVGFAVLNFSWIAEMLGKNAETMSGRLPLWRGIIEVAQDAPLQGYGWGAIWRYSWLPAPPNEISDRVNAEVVRYLSHGHNAVLDVLVQVGVVGTVLILLIALVALVAIIAAIKPLGTDPHSIPGTLVIVVLAALFTTGLTEPMFTVPVGWFALITVAAVADGAMRSSRAIRRSRPGSA